MTNNKLVWQCCLSSTVFSCWMKLQSLDEKLSVLQIYLRLMFTLRSSCSSNVKSRIFFWDDDMFPVLVKSINSVKHLIISLRLWSTQCWDLGVCKWRVLELWLTSLAEWEVCHDWSVVDGGFLAFWWLPRVKFLKAPLPNLGEAFETDLDCLFRADRQT